MTRGQSVTLYTDGACSGNPGPGGWGVVLSQTNQDGSETMTELSGGDVHTTNNRMEMMAAIEGLRVLAPQTSVTLYTDSTYVKDGITRWIKNWKARGWKTAANQPVKNQDLWESLDALTGNLQISWQWVKGHSGVPGNEKADQLARNAIVTVLMENA